jgi:hypothetical protein
VRVPAPRPAAGRAGSGPAPRFRTSAALAVAVAGALGAWAPPAPTAPTASRDAGSPVPTPTTTASRSPALTTAPGGSKGPELLLLADAEGTRTLSLLRQSGDCVALPLPDPSTVAVVPTTDGGLVALLADGQVFETPRGVPGLRAGDRWRSLLLAGTGELPAGTIVFFGASLSPDGTTLAAIARPTDTEAPGALVLVAPGRGRRDVLPLGGQSAGTPPAWIDDERVAILQRDRFDRTYLAIVATAGRAIVDRISLRALDFRTSGDTRAAVVLGDEGRLLVGSTTDVVEGRAAPDGGPATPAADRTRGGLALDDDGRRLAVAVDEGDDGPGRIAVYERVGDTWRAGVRLAAPAGSHGGFIAWLP